MRSFLVCAIAVCMLLGCQRDLFPVSEGVTVAYNEPVEALFLQDYGLVLFSNTARGCPEVSLSSLTGNDTVEFYRGRLLGLRDAYCWRAMDEGDAFVFSSSSETTQVIIQSGFVEDVWVCAYERENTLIVFDQRDGLCVIWLVSTRKEHAAVRLLDSHLNLVLEGEVGGYRVSAARLPTIPDFLEVYVRNSEGDWTYKEDLQFR
jgi:hypothetical protein